MLEQMTWLIYAIIIFVILAIVAIVSPRYTVVPAHQAHVVVKRKRRTVYCSRQGFSSSYFFMPLFHKRSILPLENIKLNIENIPLRDKDMAKFNGDVRCWLSIEDPNLAAEKLGKVEPQQKLEGFAAIEADVKDLIQAITRNSSMTMDVFSIMKEREKFSNEVQKEVAPILKDEWGIKIADLEVIHFTDFGDYKIITNLERRQAKVIEAATRKQVAGQERDAVMSEAIAEKDREVQRAESEEEYKKRQIERDENIGIATQEKNLKISEAMVDANEQAIEAKRKMEVGTAEVNKEATIEAATGEAESTKLKGFAEADVTKQKLFAEAEGTEKKALALKQYTDAGLSLEVIKANVEIKQAQFNALAAGLTKANINLVTSGEKSILGIPISAETGADLGAMLLTLSNQGIDIKDLLDKIPLAETAKLAIAAKAGVEIVKEADKQQKKTVQEKKRSAKQ